MKYPEESEFLTAIHCDEHTDIAHERRPWEVRLSNIEDKELYRLEDRLGGHEQQTDIDVVRDLAQLVRNYEDQVKGRVADINKLLETPIFDPTRGTHGRLELSSSKDETIDRFRALLKECTMHRNAPDIGEKVKALAEMIRIDGSDKQRAMRSKIEDPRNWYMLEIVEYSIDEDGAKTDQKRYSSTSQLSGGQKERVSNMFFGAGISSAFGAHDPQRRPRAFMTLILDEAFSNSSNENAHTSMRIFGQMGIQIVTSAPYENVGKVEKFASHIIYVKRDPISEQSTANTDTLTPVEEE